MKLKSPASDSLGEGQRNAQSTLGNEYNLSNQSQEQGGDKTEKSISFPGSRSGGGEPR